MINNYVSINRTEGGIIMKQGLNIKDIIEGEAKKVAPKKEATLQSRTAETSPTPPPQSEPLGNNQAVSDLKKVEQTLHVLAKSDADYIDWLIQLRYVNRIMKLVDYEPVLVKLTESHGVIRNIDKGLYLVQAMGKIDVSKTDAQVKINKITGAIENHLSKLYKECENIIQGDLDTQLGSLLK